MTGEEKDDMVNGIKNIGDTIRNDEGNFETKITYLNAGAITLVLTFLSFQNGCFVGRIWLIAGILLCGISLTYNMMLYLIAKGWHRDNINELCKSIDEGIYKCPDDLIDIVCKKIDFRNWITLILMVIGTVNLIIFICKNL